MCPLGAFAFYLHYIYDEKKIIDTLKLDYKVNKSWRQVPSFSFVREYISNINFRSEFYMDQSPRLCLSMSKIYTIYTVERTLMLASSRVSRLTSHDTFWVTAKKQ
jgi:hypothetical protein